MPKVDIRKVALSVFIGFDTRQALCFAVARSSVERNCSAAIRARGIVLDTVRRQGLYNRPTEVRENGELFDVISGAPMSTEFAISRFLVPHLVNGRGGLALFMDSDVLVRRNLHDLFALADDRHAITVVKHQHTVQAGEIKMDGRAQLAEIDPRAAGRYTRKNWSSVVLWNLDHPANRRLTVEMVNTLPGRDLHRFCWLEDEEIGELSPCWNYLVGHTVLPEGETPAILHWTDGAPCLPGFEETEYSGEFWLELARWAA